MMNHPVGAVSCGVSRLCRSCAGVVGGGGYISSISSYSESPFRYLSSFCSFWMISSFRRFSMPGYLFAKAFM